MEREEIKERVEKEVRRIRWRGGMELEERANECVRRMGSKDRGKIFQASVEFGILMKKMFGSLNNDEK